MKRYGLVLMILLSTYVGVYAQCSLILQEKIGKYEAACKSKQIQIKQLDELILEFQNIEAICEPEIGNRAALYVGRIKVLKQEIQEKQRMDELKRKKEEQRIAEQERMELERVQREKEERIAKNLIYIEGYGRLKEGEDYPIVSLIKGNLSRKYKYKYSQVSEKALWGVYIAIDSRNVHFVENEGRYMAYAVPMMVIKNLVSGEVVYEGSGLEFSDDYKGEDAKYYLGNEELAAIRGAFRKTMNPLSLTISNFIPYE